MWWATSRIRVYIRWQMELVHKPLCAPRAAHFLRPTLLQSIRRDVCATAKSSSYRVRANRCAFRRPTPAMPPALRRAGDRPAPTRAVVRASRGRRVRKMSPRASISIGRARMIWPVSRASAKAWPSESLHFGRKTDRFRTPMSCSMLLELPNSAWRASSRTSRLEQQPQGPQRPPNKSRNPQMVAACAEMVVPQRVFSFSIVLLPWLQRRPRGLA